MAEDDVELDIGLKLDDQFTDSFQKTLASLSEKTQATIAQTLDQMKGAATKIWGELPFASMHDNTVGNKLATQAFITSLAADLKAEGFKSSSNVYKAALLNAQYASSLHDAEVRMQRMQAEGLVRAADMTAPDTDLGKVIQTDWELMSIPWSRDFITTKKHRGIKEEDLEKLHVPELKVKAENLGIPVKSRATKGELIDAIVQKSKASDTYIDFAGMREKAVEQGIGRWIDPDKGHIAENFELINKALETVEDKSSKAGKNFEGWGHALKGALGTITAIGSMAVKLTGAAVGTGAVAYKLAERTTLATAAANDRRRGFLGITSADDAATQVASASVSLAPKAIFDDIAKLSTQRENFLKFGKGLDPVYSSLQGTFNILTGTENPYLAYKEMVDKLYKGLRNAPQELRQQSLMLLDNQGLNTISYIVGAFLSNPELAKEYDYTPSKLFRVEPNKYREGAVNTAEIQTARIAGLNESLKKSYGQMSTDFEEAFGLPFKTWWEETMENKVVPTFQKIAAAVKPFTDHFFRSEEQKKKDEEEAAIAFGSLEIYNTLEGQKKARDKAINEDQAWKIGWQYQKPRGALPGFRKGSLWEGYLTPATSGAGAEGYWNLFESIAKNTEKMEGPAAGVRERVQKMRDTMRDKGLYRLLTNNKVDEADVPLMQAMQLGAYSDKGLEQFNKLVDAMIGTVGANIDLSEVVTVLQSIEKNTGKTDQVLENEYLKAYILSYGGLPMYQRMEEALNTYKNQNIDRSH